MPQERLIRKYANRRLYDTGTSRHVTLEDLRAIVVSGEKLKIVDDKSGQDLTRAVMLQILTEQEQFGTPVLSTELLEMIIRLYGRPTQALFSRYLEQSFTTMLKQQESMQAEMAKALRAPLAPFADMARQNMQMWEQVQAATRDAFSGPPGSAAGEAPAADSRTRKSRADSKTRADSKKGK